MKTTATNQETARRRRTFSAKDRLTLGVFIGIPTFFHLLLVWIPAILTIALSFTFWTGIRIEDIKWAGLDNYYNIFFETPRFWQALGVNVAWLLWFGLIATPLGILLAYQIDRQIRGHQFYQTAYYLPVVLSMAVIGIIWNFLLRPDGFINGLLGLPISEAISFFGDDKYNLWVLLIMGSWRHIGYIMLLYLAGLKAIDAALREAASIDGATEWQTFRKVIFPAMAPVNIIVIVITIIESLRAFDMIYIIYGGRGGVPILGVLVFENIAGEGASMKGAAYAVILFLLSIIPIIAYLRQQFKEYDEHYRFRKSSKVPRPSKSQRQHHLDLYRHICAGLAISYCLDPVFIASPIQGNTSKRFAFVATAVEPRQLRRGDQPHGAANLLLEHRDDYCACGIPDFAIWFANGIRCNSLQLQVQRSHVAIVHRR